MITNEQKANEIAVAIMKEGHIDKNGMCQRRDLERAAMQMSEWKDTQRRTPSDDTTEGFVHIVIGEVACHETELERQIEQGKAFAESNKTVFDVAMAVAASYQEYAESQRVVIKLLSEENDELRERIAVLNGQNEALEAQLKKARAANVEFFDNVKRLEAENAKLKQKLSELQTAVCDWGETEDILNG